MISVVIPTLNAAACLEQTLQSLMGGTKPGLIGEIIISDGGSSDATLEIAQRHGCRIVRSPRKGRGSQLHHGAGAAEGDWLFFLHADTTPAHGWQAAVAAFMADSDNAGRCAAFRFKLNDSGWKARGLEKLVALRCRLVRLPYGDQGLLIKTAFYHQCGGYSMLPLMEDVEFIRRIGGRRVEILPVDAITSAERYIEEGYFRRMLRNVWCISLWFMGFSMERISRNYG